MLSLRAAWGLPRIDALRGTRRVRIVGVGLAARHGPKLATFDQRIPAGVVRGGPQALEMIPV